MIVRGMNSFAFIPLTHIPLPLSMSLIPIIKRTQIVKNFTKLLAAHSKAG